MTARELLQSAARGNAISAAQVAAACATPRDRGELRGAVQDVQAMRARGQARAMELAIELAPRFPEVPAAVGGLDGLDDVPESVVDKTRGWR
jgi:hypothetical protein